MEYGGWGFINLSVNQRFNAEQSDLTGVAELISLLNPLVEYNDSVVADFRRNMIGLELL